LTPRAAAAAAANTIITEDAEGANVDALLLDTDTITFSAGIPRLPH